MQYNQKKTNMETYIIVLQSKKVRSTKITRITKEENFTNACKKAEKIIREELNNEFKIKTINEA